MHWMQRLMEVMSYCVWHLARDAGTRARCMAQVQPVASSSGASDWGVGFRGW